MAYFDLFPNIQLPSYNKHNSSLDYTLSKNLFKRAKIREDLFQNVTSFDKFTVVGDTRPDQVAERLYGDSGLDWVILISNNILNVREEWPIAQTDLNNYLLNKYSDDQLRSVHHYETKKISDSAGNIVMGKGNIVDQNFSFEFLDQNINKTVTGSDLVNSVTWFEWEIEKNEAKRNIFVLRPTWLEFVMEDMKEIMTYKNSSQYINSRNKKGTNLRILSPR
tara:strand:- start:495 stop:1157 length:663 start_codon:yes stop_codon:yes gene_type:complete